MLKENAEGVLEKIKVQLVILGNLQADDQLNANIKFPTLSL